ncbi:Uma2 family endonuclease [Candidatus Chloroploca sp. M-50]|uniref:Uma2 family endonuclease n=1 Tax=Candidatus Chloroploca mongolica TaxID=2528176 RepID=A0ABS4DFQ1_9CHLR|nr:Uma2 family endonuclease [Candidatus Chloroploca mongolica]MBP1468252.1 Uma2 family endonuclease [Candidatus Chloroploca mongolica]
MAVFVKDERGQPGVTTTDVPPLNSGDRLSQAAFEQIYRAHPELKKAELVEGVVYVASPVHFKHHGRPHYLFIAWLGAYESATPGVIGADNATVRLDFENEVQPDVLLRLPPERGGRSRVSPDDYLEGAPELIIEVAASSAAYDLHDKRRAYARNGVAEYLVLSAYEQEVHWFALRESVYTPVAPDSEGLLRSAVFPGLWLDPAALWRGDLAAMLTALQRGLASPEHAAFVARLRDGATG